MESISFRRHFDKRCPSGFELRCNLSRHNRQIGGRTLTAFFRRGLGAKCGAGDFRQEVLKAASATGPGRSVRDVADEAGDDQAQDCSTGPRISFVNPGRG